MKKFFIVISGIYLVGLGILSGLSLVLGLFLAQSRAVQIQIVNPGFSIVINLVLVAIVVATGIGIILRKNWSRYVLFVLSGLAIFTGLILCIITVFMSFPVETPEAAPIAKISILIFNSIFFFAIPVFFLVFFSRGSVKELFISKEKLPLEQSKRPFGITFIAGLMLFGALSSGIQVFLPTSIKIPIVGSIFISGNLARLYCLIFTVISLYIALGLFRLKKSAWIAYVVFHVYGLIVTVINIFTFNETTLIEMMPEMAESAYSMPDALLKSIIAISMIFGIALLAYVYSKKHLFFENCNPDTI